jgi:hypothetical protein
VGCIRATFNRKEVAFKAACRGQTQCKWQLFPDGQSQEGQRLTKTQKRRDQNRVSQRAFRQRKEKHTKELELKVEELETLLENASQENSIVTSQMTKMEEELCYYRRLLFAGSNGNPVVFTPPSSETSALYANSNSWAQSHAYSTATSNDSSSAHSSPTLSNIPGDFAPAGSGDSFWGGYDVAEVPQTQQYPNFKYADTSAYLGHGQRQW